MHAQTAVQETSRSSAPASPACQPPGCSVNVTTLPYTKKTRASADILIPLRCKAPKAKSPSIPASSSTTRPTYPNLTALFDHLNVPTQSSDMSFAVSLANGDLEYSGSNLAGLFAQKRNLFRPRFWSMLLDLQRFYREAPGDIARLDKSSRDPRRLSRCGRLWRRVPATTTCCRWRRHLVRSFRCRCWIIRPLPSSAFTTIMGCCKLRNRPPWRTVSGGSRAYVERLTAHMPIASDSAQA